MAGEDKAIEILLDKMWALKKVGVQVFILGHTKKRTMTDPASGLEYDMLTTNMSHRYFNAIKTKLHILGVASINRQIEHTIVKQKVGADKKVGSIVDESRIITFRDDNFNIDSKSRFSDITPSIPLDVDAFINAINDAIKASYEKQKGKTKSIEETKKQQDKDKDKKVEEIVADKKKNKIDEKKNIELISIIQDKFTKSSDGIKEKVKEVMSEYEIGSFKNPDETPTEGLQKIADLLK